MQEGNFQLIEAIKKMERLLVIASSPSRAQISRLEPELVERRKVFKRAQTHLKEVTDKNKILIWFLYLVSNQMKTLTLKKDLAQTQLLKTQKSYNDNKDTLEVFRVAIRELKEIRQKMDQIPDIGKSTICASILNRISFLEKTTGQDGEKAQVLGNRLLPLVKEIFQAYELFQNGGSEPTEETRVSVPEKILPGKTYGGSSTSRSQLALDFTGSGNHEQEARIWLPVSVSRTREMVERGVMVNKEGGRRGSNLWVPISERHKVDSFLPLAYRERPTHFSFPPIRFNAAKQNLWSMFDSESWNHIRTTAYDRAGHRCQICGKQGGSLWNRIASQEELKKSGPVDCHEVWEWIPPEDENSTTGIQKLKRLLVVCKDCHMMFHDGFFINKARDSGLELQAVAYLEKMRMLINRQDRIGLNEQLTQDSAEWEKNKSVTTWIIDLSHLAAQDFMVDHTLVLQQSNKANVTPNMIGGIGFQTQDGVTYGAVSAEELVRGEPTRLISSIGQSRI
jgi:hypothetical protein